MNRDSRGRGRKSRYFETLGEFGCVEGQRCGGLGLARMKKLHSRGEKSYFLCRVSRYGWCASGQARAASLGLVYIRVALPRSYLWDRAAEGETQPGKCPRGALVIPN